MTLGTPSERSERALRDLARGEAQNGIAPGEGVTSHPSHPLDPPLSGSSDEKAIPGRHLKAPRITGMRLISLALFGRWRCLRDAHCTRHKALFKMACLLAYRCTVPVGTSDVNASSCAG